MWRILLLDKIYQISNEILGVERINGLWTSWLPGQFGQAVTGQILIDDDMLAIISCKKDKLIELK